MQRTSLLVLVLVATGCGSDGSSQPPPTTNTDGSDTSTSASSNGSSGQSKATNTTGSSTSNTATSNATASGTLTTGASATNTATSTTNGASSVASNAGSNTSGVTEIPGCETVVSFDSAWGVAATSGGTNPEAWETSVTPSITGGVFSVEVPFTSSAQQFGWNGEHPQGPVDCTGRELVARVRLVSGFVENPQSAPGGVLMYLFSDEWVNSMTAWNNVPAPSDDWFEVSVACDASADSDFDPKAVNGIGFTFNTGGADTEAYAATNAVFEVDQLCWRGEGETGDAGAGGEPDAGPDDTEAGDAGASSPDASVTSVDESDSTPTNVTSSASSSASATSASASSAGSSSASSSTSGASTSATGTSLSTSASSASSSSSTSTSPGECEIFVDFNSPWGFVATGGGTNPQAWETQVEPLMGDGLFNVSIPFTSSAQQYGWNGNYPGGPIDCTGWELVVRVRLLSTPFVENPTTLAGGVQAYLFSGSWGAAINQWNVVDESLDEWFEASVACEAVEGSNFNPANVNAVGFTFNSGGQTTTDYDAYEVEFDVDHLCWRK